MRDKRKRKKILLGIAGKFAKEIKELLRRAFMNLMWITRIVAGELDVHRIVLQWDFDGGPLG